MIPKEIFNPRRGHRNTPPTLLLIITNYIVTSVLFTSTTTANWFFFLVLFVLALYNVYTIRRNRDEITKPNIITYFVSFTGIIALYIITRMAQ